MLQHLLITSLSWNCLTQPVQVWLVALLNGSGDDFADVVGMVVLDKLGQFRNPGRSRLDHHQKLAVIFNLALPLVHRSDAGYDVDTRCQLLGYYKWKKRTFYIGPPSSKCKCCIWMPIANAFCWPQHKSRLRRFLCTYSKNTSSCRYIVCMRVLSQAIST